MAELTRTTPMRLMGLFAVLAILGAACTQPSASPTDGAVPTGTAPPDDGAPTGELGTYTLGIFQDATTDNLWNYNDTEGSTVWNQYVLSPTSAGAYTVSYPGIEFVPDLADGELQPAVQEGDSWVGEFTLREGLTWSDDEPITAEDWAFTWNTVVDLELQGGWIDYTDYAPDNGPITAVEAVDETTVAVHFNTQPGLALWGPGTSVLL